jgi:transposase
LFNDKLSANDLYRKANLFFPIDFSTANNAYLDGLAGCVEQILHADPLSGHLFIFFNRRRNQVKILVWDRTGFCIYCRRLEQGRFTLPSGNMVTDFARLLLILEGIDLSGSKQRKRFSLKKS